MFSKIKSQTIYIAISVLVVASFAYAKKVAPATKKQATTNSVYLTVKTKSDEIIEEKALANKITKLNTLVKLIKSKIDEYTSKQTTAEAEQNPYLAAWQDADYEFDFLKTLFVDGDSNEFINCDTVANRLSEGLSDEIKKESKPYIELAKRVSKDICSAQAKKSP
jgi:hypothetical protein